MTPEILLVGPVLPHVMAALDAAYRVRRLYEAEDRDALLAEVGPASSTVCASTRTEGPEPWLCKT